MTITFYTNNSEKIKLDKDLTEVLTLTGTLREGTTILDPVILFEKIGIGELAGVNYARIEEFRRNYFITDIRAERNNLTRIAFHVDVLTSYAEQIRAQRAIIGRQESQWNLYLNDGQMLAYQNPIIKTQLFPNGLDDDEYVLAVSGSSVS